MRHLEDNLQIACVEWFDYSYGSIKKLLHSSPNGGFRNAREAAKFKAMGTRAGFPDLLLLHPNKDHIALAIELKIGKNSQSVNQKEWQEQAEKIGVRYVVIKTFPDFMDEVNSYLKGV